MFPLQVGVKIVDDTIEDPLTAIAARVVAGKAVDLDQIDGVPLCELRCDTGPDVSRAGQAGKPILLT